MAGFESGRRDFRTAVECCKKSKGSAWCCVSYDDPLCTCSQRRRVAAASAGGAGSLLYANCAPVSSHATVACGVHWLTRCRLCIRRCTSAARSGCPAVSQAVRSTLCSRNESPRAVGPSAATALSSSPKPTSSASLPPPATACARAGVGRLSGGEPRRRSERPARRDGRREQATRAGDGRRC